MTAVAARRSEWRTARGLLPIDRPLILGILNLTPDSFWDGGRHATLDRAVAHAERLLEEGADLLDLGGESTRPGAQPVTATAESARLLPVLTEVVRRWPTALVSVDTVKAEVAQLALAEGAAIINDVSALRLDRDLGAVVAAAGAGLVLMHSRGGVADMASYRHAQYGGDPVAEVMTELQEGMQRARQAGIAEEALVLDPGLGFSKRTAESQAMVRELPRLAGLGRPLLVGPSRKRFVGELGGGLSVEERLEGTLAVCVVALLRGARLFRVHDVQPARRALDVAWSLID